MPSPMRPLATAERFFFSAARRRAPFGALLLAAVLASCAHATIPGTQAQDTPANREVYAVLQRARDCLQARDAECLLSVISTRYFEDNGTPDPHDDYGYLELKERYAAEAMQTAKDVQVGLQIYEIQVRGERAWADLRYTSRVRFELPSGRLWDSYRDFDRVELLREGGAWRIVRGL